MDASTTARSTTFSSSRTLPGQVWSSSNCIASGSKRSMRAPVRIQKLLVLLAELLEEVLDQQRNIFAPVAQRRQIDVDDVQPVVKIFAEFLLFHHLAQIRIGGGQNPHIHLHDFVRTERRELLLLNHAQQLGLRLRPDRADFIEEDRALVGDLERALLVVNGAGERALSHARTEWIPAVRWAANRC